MDTRAGQRPRAGAWSLVVLALVPVGASSLKAGDLPMGGASARVRFIESSVTLERPAQGTVEEASVDSPVTAGVVVGTRDGRAVIEMADTSTLCMDVGTRVEVRALANPARLIERANLLVIMEGRIRVDLHARAPGGDTMRIETTAASIDLLSSGSYRIDVSGGTTVLSSYGGVAEFSGDEGSVLVRSGQRSSVRSGQSPCEPVRFVTPRAEGVDAFHDDQVSQDDDEHPGAIRPDTGGGLHGSHAARVESGSPRESTPPIGHAEQPGVTGPAGQAVVERLIGGMRPVLVSPRPATSAPVQQGATPRPSDPRGRPHPPSHPARPTDDAGKPRPDEPPKKGEPPKK